MESIKSTAFWIVIAIIFTAYIAKTSISIYPFKIKVERPYEAMAFIFLILSLMCFKIQNYRDGYKASMNDAIEFLKEKK